MALAGGQPLGTFDVDELLLGQRLVVDGVCAVLCDVLLDEPPLVDMIRDRGHTRVLWHFIGDCREKVGPWTWGGERHLGPRGCLLCCLASTRPCVPPLNQQESRHHTKPALNCPQSAFRLHN